MYFFGASWCHPSYSLLILWYSKNWHFFHLSIFQFLEIEKDLVHQKNCQFLEYRKTNKEHKRWHLEVPEKCIVGYSEAKTSRLLKYFLHFFEYLAPKVQPLLVHYLTWVFWNLPRVKSALPGRFYPGKFTWVKSNLPG